MYPNLAKSLGACLPPPSYFTNLKNKKTRVFGRYLILIIPNGSSYYYYYFRIREALVLRVYWGKKRLENHHFRLNKKSQRTSDFIGGYLIYFYFFCENHGYMSGSILWFFWEPTIMNIKNRFNNHRGLFVFLITAQHWTIILYGFN